MSDLPPPPPPPPGDAGFPGALGGGLPYPPYPPTERNDLPPTGPGSPGVIAPRVGARIIDGLLVSLPFAIYSQRYIETRGDEVIDDRPAWLFVLMAIVPLVYEIALVAWRGQTLGKMVLSLKIIRYADGGPILTYQSAIRTIVPTLPSLVAIALPVTVGQFVGLLGIVIYLTAAFDPVYRGLHDKAAGSIVLRTK